MYQKVANLYSPTMLPNKMMPQQQPSNPFQYPSSYSDVFQVWYQLLQIQKIKLTIDDDKLSCSSHSVSPLTAQLEGEGLRQDSYAGSCLTSFISMSSLIVILFRTYVSCAKGLVTISTYSRIKDTGRVDDLMWSEFKLVKPIKEQL